MIKLLIPSPALDGEGNVIIGIPSEMLAQMVRESMPDELMVKGKATGKWTLIKSGLKAIIPTLLTLGREKMKANGQELPPYDLRCAEAKENMIAYGVAYIMAVSTQALDGARFIAQAQVDDDGQTNIITGILTPLAGSAPALAAPETATAPAAITGA